MGQQVQRAAQCEIEEQQTAQKPNFLAGTDGRRSREQPAQGTDEEEISGPHQNRQQVPRQVPVGRITKQLHQFFKSHGVTPSFRGTGVRWPRFLWPLLAIDDEKKIGRASCREGGWNRGEEGGTQTHRNTYRDSV